MFHNKEIIIVSITRFHDSVIYFTNTPIETLRLLSPIIDSHPPLVRLLKEYQAIKKLQDEERLSD